MPPAISDIDFLSKLPLANPSMTQFPAPIWPQSDVPNKQQITDVSDKLEKWGDDNYWGDDLRNKQIVKLESRLEEVANVLEASTRKSAGLHVFEILGILGVAGCVGCDVRSSPLPPTSSEVPAFASKLHCTHQAHGKAEASGERPQLLRRLMDNTSLPPPPPPSDSLEQINALSEKLEKWGLDNYWGDDKLMKRLDAVEKLSNETSAFLDRIATEARAHDSLPLSSNGQVKPETVVVTERLSGAGADVQSLNLAEALAALTMCQSNLGTVLHREDTSSASTIDIVQSHVASNAEAAAASEGDLTEKKKAKVEEGPPAQALDMTADLIYAEDGSLGVK
ncbi:hypothetical protein COCSUDRAFT_63370 [Coccomyxa subellipsoidea C-169]|uniref:Uncharacterized protein n=1 Tax=Coccomyxa subellipsoidea (strain C-169) TaxID=574566 RepID=I0YX61_COCSC|nr:hypothetical protein COCSUDRAFT_63370 [Coccomyxa subellipsoidea C-169]EIE22980.1 hypothetical protein COCSUDRAFT_63370 [Coccomyxa subellipsoidea C-169]|eukprot:XP_005647524.1 hypothetical protein COCSUDRAFT_63370 [Coccomyxa subellipsoidea C-169]